MIPAALDRTRVDHALICANKVTFTSKIDETAQQLSDMFDGRASIVELSMENPLLIADHLQQEIKKLQRGTPTTYAIDVTSFTHEALLILLRVLQAAVKSEDNVIGLYNGATDYATGLPAEEKWLSKGVAEIRSVLGYPGEIVPTQKIHLIVLVGFEMERAERIIGAYEPSLLSLGYGSPLQSISFPLHNLNKRFHKRLSDRYKGVREFTFSLEDPLEAKLSIEKQAKIQPGFNVFIAPMNTKISTVGVALAAFENEALQICYASAEQYNFQSYSSPSNDCYIFEVPLLKSVIT